MKMKNWFELNKPYQFETNDVIGLLNLFNTFAVIRFGLVASWFGLALAIACVIDDIVEVRRLNLIVLHLSIAILNLYFLLTLYNFI